MRKTVALLIGIICIFLFASCASTETFAISSFTPIQKVIEVPNVSSNDLFVRANNWMVNSFVNADSVIEYSDKDAGIIKGKFTNTLTYFGGTVRSTTIITIETKENKARISFGLASVNMYNGYGVNQGSANNYTFGEKNQQALRAIWESTINDFENAIKQEAINW